MRILLYVASLVASAWALSSAFRMLYFGAITLVAPLAEVPSGLLTVLLYVVVFSPFTLLGVRAFIWFKQRRVAAPTSFQGFPYAVACIAGFLVVLTALGYAVLLFSGSAAGLSGAPIGMLLFVCGAVLALAMPVVEVRDWRTLLQARQRVEFNQVPNPSIEGTSNSKLRLPSAAPHVKR